MANKRKYVYKCVRAQGPKKFCSYSPPHHQLTLSYSLLKWTRAFNGTVGIFVFLTLREAKNYNRSTGCAVLKGEYVGDPLLLGRRMDYAYSRSALGLKSLVSIFSTPNKRARMIDKVNSGDGSLWNKKGFKYYQTLTPFSTHVVNAVKPVKCTFPNGQPKYFAFVNFIEGRGLPEWMTNKWRIRR